MFEWNRYCNTTIKLCGVIKRSNVSFVLPGVVLWPNIPLKKQGMRMLPPMSEPMPMTEPAAPSMLPSPPEARRGKRGWTERERRENPEGLLYPEQHHTRIYVIAIRPKRTSAHNKVLRQESTPQNIWHRPKGHAVIGTGKSHDYCALIHGFLTFLTSMPKFFSQERPGAH